MASSPDSRGNPSSKSRQWQSRKPAPDPNLPRPNDAQYCTLESFSTTAGESQESDNTCESPVSASCVTEDLSDVKDMLKELENVMLGPEPDAADSFDSFNQLLMGIPKGDIKHVLIACAKAIADDNLAAAEWLITELRHMVSVSGEPIQRLGAYLLEGLVARIFSSGSAIYKALKCDEPASSDLLSYMHILYEICPFFKFGYISANGAIVEAVGGEDRVHIVDFHITQGSQWLILMRALASRPGGPPFLRITGVDDSVSAYARGGGLDLVGQRMSRFAESLNVPFEFHPLVMSGCEAELKAGSLNLRPEEALVVNFSFQLHHLPDESGLAPTVVTIVEQESNTNTSAFFPRFLETLDYYTAIFDSIDVMLPREQKERISVEQHCLAREIVNIIACEGRERVERHELHGKWKSRLRMAGFAPFPLSPTVNAGIKALLENYCDKYKLEERDGALYLGWMDRVLVVSSAWK
ncbi:Chitin-inducible gibberellin-responsive protein 2 [Platanthera guangdongensis]|uniref:Chitin-inducible gibberellin-responsive protein 2 n=1 Tax=Platanthera guangdongensis TaxID=2320717 RepID=A0ABR2LLE5_9ASPA